MISPVRGVCSVGVPGEELGLDVGQVGCGVGRLRGSSPSRCSRRCSALRVRCRPWCSPVNDDAGIGSQEPVGQDLDLDRRACCTHPRGERFDHIASAEHRRPLGQAGRARQLVEHSGEMFGCGPFGRGLVQASSCLRRVEPGGIGLGSPQVEQGVGVDLIVLGLAGLQGGDLRCSGRGVARLGQHFGDLSTPLREDLQHLGRHAVDVCVAVGDRSPLDTHAGGQQMTEMGLIEMARCLGVLEQAIPGDGPPHRPFLAVDPGHVRHHDMGVQQRIARPARPMIKRRRNHPIGLRQVAALLTRETGPHRPILEIPDHLVHRLRVRTTKLSPYTRLRKCPEHAHALRRPQRHVIPRPRLARSPLRSETLDLLPLGSATRRHRSCPPPEPAHP